MIFLLHFLKPPVAIVFTSFAITFLPQLIYYPLRFAVSFVEIVYMFFLCLECLLSVPDQKWDITSEMALDIVEISVATSRYSFTLNGLMMLFFNTETGSNLEFLAKALFIVVFQYFGQFVFVPLLSLFVDIIPYFRTVVLGIFTACYSLSHFFKVLQASELREATRGFVSSVADKLCLYSTYALMSPLLLFFSEYRRKVPAFFAKVLSLMGEAAQG